MSVINFPPEESDYLNVLFKKDIFNNEECEYIKSLSLDKKINGFYEKPNEIIKSIEKSVVSTRLIELSKNTNFIFKKLIGFTNEVNNNYYKFDISNLKDTQIIDLEMGSFFDWHFDIGENMASTRKISIITVLSNPDEIKGGNMVWKPTQSPGEIKVGTTIFFPSYLISRIDPILKGNMSLMLSWAHGPAFR